MLESQSKALAKRDPYALPTRRGASVALPPRFPGLDDLDAARRWVSLVPRPWAVDLFCGAGGLSLGLQRSGINVVAAADSDLYAAETHSANVGGLCWTESLADPAPFLDFLSDRGVDHVDVVAGGPPCQPFSRAGGAKIRSLVERGIRPASDPRADLWKSYRKVLEALRPSVALVENVPDMAAAADGSLMVDLVAMFRDLGYVPEVKVLRAEDFGVPQHRARLFVVARKTGEFRWPNRRARVTLRDAIGDLPRVEADQRCDSLDYEGPATQFQKRARLAVPKAEEDLIRDHCTRAVRKDDAEAFELLEEGGTYADLPPKYQRYRTDIFDDKYKRLRWSDVSRTITAHIAKDGYWYIHPDQPRTLSIREAARLQTFSDDVRFAGPPTQQLRQIGNAVPPVLAYAVCRRVRDCLSSDSPASELDIIEPLGRWFAERHVMPRRSPDDAWPFLVGLVVAGGKVTSRRSELESIVAEGFSTPASLMRQRDKFEDAAEGLAASDRVERVIELADRVTRKHEGRVPETVRELRALPHVSETSAATMVSEIFDKPILVIDTPRRRVVERISGRGSEGIWGARLELICMAGKSGPSRTFNTAIRALADEVCTAADPDCSGCPVASQCATAPARNARR